MAANGTPTPGALWRQTAGAMLEGLRSDAITVDALVEAHEARIAEREPVVHAWCWHEPSAAAAQARALGSQSKLLPLFGLPVGIKDIIDTRDMPTACGSPIYRDHRPAQDAVVVERLRRAGAIIMGKTVTTEFAYVHPGPTLNPHHAAYTPGGSSSGSAAAVADGMVPLALATQTGGSTIRPAAYCGIVGFKPSFGRIPMAGVKYLAPSLDTLGLYGRSVDDVTRLFSVTADHTGREIASVSPACRIGYYPGPYAAQADADAHRVLGEACARLRAASVTVEPIDLPPDLFAQLGPANKTIMAYEAARALATEFTSHRAQLSPALCRLIEQGQATTENQYRAALACGQEAAAAMAQAMRQFDSLITFSAPGGAPVWSAGTGDSTFNRAWTTIGAPCLTLPLGQNDSGLPLGVQLVDAPGADARLLAVARLVEPVFAREG